jgi:hypothetical protein
MYYIVTISFTLRENVPYTYALDQPIRINAEDSCLLGCVAASLHKLFPMYRRHYFPSKHLKPFNQYYSIMSRKT